MRTLFFGIFGATLATAACAFQTTIKTTVLLPKTRTRDVSNGMPPPLKAARYGPPPPGADGMPGMDPPRSFVTSAKQIQEFRQLLEKVMAVPDPQHIPSLLTRNMDLILALNGEQGVGVVQSVLEQARQETDNNPAVMAQLEQAIDLTLSFAQDFVDTASSLDKQNKQLLGKILRTMSNKAVPARQREEDLNALFTAQRDNFTAGFLRHLQGACEQAAQSTAPDAARTLEMLRVIQTRVLEEVGQDLGQGAVVLGQLIGYDDDAERNAVLEAGLMVRGVDFALELQALTTEALDGLARVPGQGADPELVRMVESIDQRIQTFLEKEQPFQ